MGSSTNPLSPNVLRLGSEYREREWRNHSWPSPRQMLLVAIVTERTHEAFEPGSDWGFVSILRRDRRRSSSGRLRWDGELHQWISEQEQVGMHTRDLPPHASL